MSNAGGGDALANIASTAIIKGKHKENTAANRNKVYDDGSSGQHTVFAHMGGAKRCAERCACTAGACARVSSSKCAR